MASSPRQQFIENQITNIIAILWSFNVNEIPDNYEALPGRKVLRERVRAKYFPSPLSKDDQEHITGRVVCEYYFEYNFELALEKFIQELKDLMIENNQKVVLGSETKD